MSSQSNGNASCDIPKNLQSVCFSSVEDLTAKRLPPDLETLHFSKERMPQTRIAIPTVLVSPSSTINSLSSTINNARENAEDNRETKINSALLSPDFQSSYSQCLSRPGARNTLRQEKSHSRVPHGEQYPSQLTSETSPLLDLPHVNQESAKLKLLNTDIELSVRARPDTDLMIHVEKPKDQIRNSPINLPDKVNLSKESIRQSFASSNSDLASTSHSSREWTWSWHATQQETELLLPFSQNSSTKSLSRLGSVNKSHDNRDDVLGKGPALQPTIPTAKAKAESLVPPICRDEIGLVDPKTARKSWSPKQSEGLPPLVNQLFLQASTSALDQNTAMPSFLAVKAQTAASESLLLPCRPSKDSRGATLKRSNTSTFSPRDQDSSSSANSSQRRVKSASLLSPSFKQHSKSVDVRNPKTIKRDSSFEQSEGSSGKRSFLSLLSPSRILSKFKRSTQSISSQNSCRHSRRKHIDHPEDEKAVVINVSGRRFKIDDYFLSVYPETLLGSKARSFFYDAEKKEYFFDRDSDAFRHIWNFYYTGYLHCPQDECLDAFVDEMKYFGLSENHMCSCCWSDVFSPEIEQLTNKRKERECEDERLEQQKRALGPDKTFRQRLWATFQDPSISLTAKILYLLSAVVILVSVLANAAETIRCSGKMRVCKEENEEEYFIIDSFCVGLFTLEYLVKLYACPSRLEFIKNYMSVIDLLAILPYYVDLILKLLSSVTQLGMDALVTLRVLRILRVFKLLRQSKRLQRLIETFKSSASELGLIVFIYMIMILVFSSVIYFAETKDNPHFGSIPESMWYAVVTTTTTG